MTQQSDPPRLSGSAHTSQTLSRSGLSPRCGGTARESIPGGFQVFREALLRTSPLNSNRSCSCTGADGGLQLHVCPTLAFLWQLHCDGKWFILSFPLYVHLLLSDLEQIKRISHPFMSDLEVWFAEWGQWVCFYSTKDVSLTCVPSLCPQAVFSSVFYFASVPLYQGFLTIG